ncbi:hypothetical protein SLA2020_440390 [Shorea laevis]
MQLLKFSVTSIPVWIKLHNLPMQFWTATCLSHVASGVGKPLCADSVTEEQLRLGFARVLVEVNFNYDFPKEIEIVGADGSPVIVGIEYPWLPLKCKNVSLLVMPLSLAPRLRKLFGYLVKLNQLRRLTIRNRLL